MPMQRCNNGHIYDVAKHASCPYCAGGQDEMEKTRPLDQMGNAPGSAPVGADSDVTRPIHGGAQGGAQVNPDSQTQKQENIGRVEERTVGPGYPPGQNVNSSDSEKTVAFWKEKTGIDPVVGWLVCIEGADKGRDYRIRMGQNTLGRGDNVAISIKGDNTISSQTHAAVIVYEPLGREFRLIAGQGRALTYLNGSGVYMPTPLTPFDRIRIGKTELLFVPLCGETFAWDIPEDSSEA